VYLILDNLKVHLSKDVAKWLEKKKDKIAVFYLPSYSPELNPDEYLIPSCIRRRTEAATRRQRR
jgi:transposase